MKRDLERENRGLSAFALLQGLDDDTVLSATLPAPKKRGFFATVASRPMAAMLVSVAVALTVLSGVLLAGRLGEGLFPSWEDPWIETQPGPPQTRPDIDNGILYPPMNENPDQAEKSQVTVVSDGITVYPQGYCVWESGQHRNEQGELEGYDADGRGAVGMLDRLWDMLPVLRTAGNSYELNLPSNATLRSVRIFETVNGIEGIFEELAIPAGAEAAADMLKSVTSRKGEYVVVLEIYHETIHSADEYTKGVDEYAFRLSVDPSMNDNAPVRILHGDKTYFPTGYLLQTSYYDAELKQEVTKQYDGAERILAELAPAMVTATVARGESLGLYLAPFYELKWVRVFDSSLRRLYEMGYDSPLDTFSETEEAGDYYVIITAVFLGTGETSVTEFPIHIKVVEEREEESTPAGDVGEIPEPPRVQVGTGFGSLYFGSKRHSTEYHEGYMLWVEEWHDGGMLCGDGFGATGQLADIAAELPALLHYEGETPTIRVTEENDTLTRIYIYRNDLSFYADTRDASTFSTLPEGGYIIVLRVETQGDYIPEAEAYERTCTEYAFVLKVVEEQAGIPGVPETNPRVVVSGGGQTAVFETEEDGFLAWQEIRYSPQASSSYRIEGTPAADVIFTDDDAMRALPDMEIAYGDTLTLTLDAAGDDLVMVYLYDAKGGFVKSGADLSVVNTLQNEGWDQHVIVILEIHTVVSETEQAGYEYAFELDIVQP